MGLAGMAITLIAGEVITNSAKLAGYQYTLLFAFFVGTISLWCFSRIRDPRGSTFRVSGSPLKLSSLARDMRAICGFSGLMVSTALWNFSLNIAGPFFTVYLVQNLHATASQVALNSIATSLSSLVAQRKLGALSDRWGARRLQLISMLLIPLLPLAWTQATSPWHAVLINLFGGALWAGFTLASFNNLLEMIPDALRARYSAFYQIVVLVSLSLGAILGGLMVTQWGYTAIFVGSAVGRWSASLLFAKFVRAPMDRLQAEADA
jgi:MFS family permease